MKSYWFFIFIFLLFFSVIVFFLSLWDIIFNKNFLTLNTMLYGILFGLSILFLLFPAIKRKYHRDYISTFKKTLYGRLYHFKCPHCNGFFAIKESMYTTKGKTVITCPDCGRLGRIQPDPPMIIGGIPENKSKNIVFQCLQCGESLKLWAEGSELYPSLRVFSCPFCGENKPLRKI